MKTLFHNFTAITANDNFLWRVILGFAFAVAIVAGVFSWSLYGEVTTQPSIPVSPKHDSDVLSINELRGVISFYQKKEEDFKILQSSPPTAPLMDKGSGVSTPINYERI